MTSAVTDNTRHWYRASLFLILATESKKKEIPMTSHVYVLQTMCTHWVMVRYIEGGSNMTGTDLCVNKPHCAAAVRP